MSVSFLLGFYRFFLFFIVNFFKKTYELAGHVLWPGDMSFPILVLGQIGQNQVSGQKGQLSDSIGQDIRQIFGPLPPIVCAVLSKNTPIIHTFSNMFNRNQEKY